MLKEFDEVSTEELETGSSTSELEDSRDSSEELLEIIVSTEELDLIFSLLELSKNSWEGSVVAVQAIKERIVRR